MRHHVNKYLMNFFLLQMPMELAEKINEINDVDVFIHDFVDDTNSLSNMSSIAQHPSNRKRKFYSFIGSKKNSKYKS